MIASVSPELPPRSITLIRHGPPTVSLTTQIRGRDFRQFVERYEAARIHRQATPPESVKRVMHRATRVFASDRPRALHTAELLGAPQQPIVDSRFREIEFPVDFPLYVRLPALVWTALALFIWRLGYSPRCESSVAAQSRARTVARLLVQEANRTGPIVLVAHGGINRLIAKELRRSGWQGPRLPHSRHWGCTTYSL
ncbi:MAG: histidine phosphatase family protein [Cyanobacteria bacterium J06632_22]